MNEEKLETTCSTSERISEERLLTSIERFKSEALMQTSIDAVSDAVFVLNEERRIVAVNRSAMQVMDARDRDCMYGLSPGDGLRCIHAGETDGGCGSAEACRQCGALDVMLASQKGEAANAECRFTDVHGNAQVFLVRAEPLTMEDERYTLFVAQDVSSETRQRALERIFFHDVLNTAGNVQGVIYLMKDESEDDYGEYIDLIDCCARTILEDVRSQKDVLAAENGRLSAEMNTVSSHDVLSEVKKVYQNHMAADERTLSIDETTDDVEFTSDARLLKRVLGNMVKNALEATPVGGRVTLGTKKDGDVMEFWVHDPGYLKREHQPLVFNRSFPKGGDGRGLKTYAMKMLSERYLHGDVSFSTSEAEGTTFRARYPITLE